MGYWTLRRRLSDCFSSFKAHSQAVPGTMQFDLNCGAMSSRGSTTRCCEVKAHLRRADSKALGNVGAIALLEEGILQGHRW
jgi:hypothetical protein